MTTNKPEAAVWLDVPADCRMTGAMTAVLQPAEVNEATRRKR